MFSPLVYSIAQESEDSDAAVCWRSDPGPIQVTTTVSVQTINFHQILDVLTSMEEGVVTIKEKSKANNFYQAVHFDWKLKGHNSCLHLWP